ncbi:MAG: biotin--[acetyl-CoA-carboxylase] ligase [Fidelibacterota bacterium]
MFLTKRFTDQLHTRYLGHDFRYFPITGSTNEDAWALVKDQYQNGMVVLAGHQKKGRGRQGAPWHSAPDTGLTFSIVYTLTINAEKLGLLALLSGVAVITAAKKFTGIPMQLKWPNDILARGKKMGGILVETRRQKDMYLVVVGIGLNVNCRQEEFAPELAASATSIFMESGTKIQREDFLAGILMQYEYYLENLKQVIPQWNIFCSHHGDMVTFRHGAEQIRGRFMGVNEFGHAIIEHNERQEIFSEGRLTL